MRFRRALVLLFALPLAACPDDDEHEPDPTPAECAAGLLGDPAKEPEVELRTLRADGADVPLAAGGDLALILPPQGGRVAFVGIRATNVDGCGLQLIGALRDPLSKQVRLDGRTVNLRKEPDGWGTTGRGAETDLASSDAIGDYSNVPLCPNLWADQDLFDHPFELEVQIKDRRGKTAVKKIEVVPRCAEAGERETSCRCLCKEGYVQGEACGEDGAPAPRPDRRARARGLPGERRRRDAERRRGRDRRGRRGVAHGARGPRRIAPLDLGDVVEGRVDRRRLARQRPRRARAPVRRRGVDPPPSWRAGDVLVGPRHGRERRVARRREGQDHALGRRVVPRRRVGHGRDLVRRVRRRARRRLGRRRDARSPRCHERRRPPLRRRVVDLHGAWVDDTGAFWGAGGKFSAAARPGATRNGTIGRYGPGTAPGTLLQ